MSDPYFDPRQNIELMDKVRNKNRRRILLRAYQAPVRYHEILEDTGLKPGSIYHHLKVLEPLIEKQEQGVYRITDLGRSVVEALEMVEDKKPVIGDQSKVEKRQKSERPTIKNTAIQEIEPQQVTEITEKEEIIAENTRELLTELWVSKYIWVFLSLSIIVSILLGLSGISLVGSGIYKVGDMAIVFDLLAFTIATGLIYVLEDLTSQYSPKDQLFNVLQIRLISMIPAVVAGISIFTLFVGGVTLTQEGFNILFIVTVLLGWFLSMAGVVVLRGRSLQYASVLTFIPTLSDLLIGLVLVLSV